MPQNTQIPHTLDPDILILTRLLEAGDQYVSGNTLAEELGMSRVGVWARMEKLRNQGFDFDAVRHRGYRISREPDSLNPLLLRAKLAVASAKPPALVFLPEVDSTNAEAERHLADGRATPFVIIAGLQTQGRGRLGRNWHSPDEGNLYMSFVFRPELPPARMQAFTLWIGLCVCRALRDYTGLEIGLKWPNDLVINRRKAGGMLTEARVDADRTRDLVFGMGLNVNCDPADWPQDVAAVAASLSGELGRPLSLNALTVELVIAVMRAYERYMEGDFAEELKAEWPRYDILRGETVTVNPNGASHTGRACGIDDTGSLLVETDTGERKSFYAGEVTLGSHQTLSR